ncbi:MAG: Porin, Gram-negative type [Rhodocyclaceae bacterium]|nr:Porin, Gram-negative type [Rhodocyclaceae bacterium]
MQKKLIALAIAGLSGAAFAQSNVTIYGVADASFENVRATSTTGGAAEFKSRNRVNSESSYIGFKGVEDLGNGLKAAFQLENGISLDNGAAGAWNNRDSYVGLVGGFGTVVAGNVTGPTRALGAKMDVNSGATGIGANTALLGKLGGPVAGLDTAGASAFDQRITNAIAYISPNFSGFSGVVGYSTGLTNGVNGAALAGRENSPAGNKATGNVAWTAGLNYENGPFYVGYAYTQVDATNNGAAATDGLLANVKKVKDNRLAGYYKFGPAQVGLLWDRPEADLGGVASGTIKQNIYYVTGKFNVTPAGAIIAQYGVARDVSGPTLGLGSNTDTGAKHIVVGYEHSLSKRTILKAVYSQLNNDANATYDYLYGVSANNSTATGGAAALGSNVRGYSVGIRHAF